MNRAASRMFRPLLAASILFGASFSDFSSYPLTVALNNLVNSSTGVKEYNVHFAGAFIAALPTLIVYLVSAKYFLRGLMAGSVKG